MWETTKANLAALVMNAVDICTISPALLETGTQRGGGCEIIDYNVALGLSKYFSIVILSAFYIDFKKIIKINDYFSIEEVPFPAQKNYPPASRLESLVISFSTYIYSILVAMSVMRLAKRNLKMIVVHNPQTAMLSVLLAKIIKIKILYAEGNIIPWTNPYTDISPSRAPLLQNGFDFFQFRLTKLMCKLADQIMAQSTSIKDGMVKCGIDPEKIKVIPGGVDTNMFMPNSEISEYRSPIKIGFVGRLTEIKGAPLLLEVVRKARKELPNVSFLIFGDGPYKHNFTYLSNIEYLGLVPHDELNFGLSKVQIVLFFQKDLGLAVHETMAAGKVIVSYNVGEIPQIIKHLENGILCAPDAQSYIDAIKRLCEDRSSIERMSRAARETAVKYFGWEVIIRDWFSLCTECLKKKGAGLK